MRKNTTYNNINTNTNINLWRYIAFKYSFRYKFSKAKTHLIFTNLQKIVVLLEIISWFIDPYHFKK